MIKWLWRLIWGGPTAPPCDHRWETECRSAVYQVDLLGNRSKLPVAAKYTLRCTKCGWVTSRRV